MTGLLSELRKSKHSPCSFLSPSLSEPRQPQVLELCCSLPVALSCRNPGLFSFQLLALGVCVPAELTLPSLEQCWCSLRWPCAMAQLLGAGPALDVLAKIPCSWSWFVSCTRVPFGVCHLPRLSDFSLLPKFLSSALFPNSVFSPQCLEFLSLSCPLLSLGSLILGDGCKTWVINCQ